MFVISLHIPQQENNKRQTVIPSRMCEANYNCWLLFSRESVLLFFLHSGNLKKQEQALKNRGLLCSIIANLFSSECFYLHLSHNIMLRLLPRLALSAGVCSHVTFGNHIVPAHRRVNADPADLSHRCTSSTPFFSPSLHSASSLCQGVWRILSASPNTGWQSIPFNRIPPFWPSVLRVAASINHQGPGTPSACWLFLADQKQQQQQDEESGEDLSAGTEPEYEEQQGSLNLHAGWGFLEEQEGRKSERVETRSVNTCFTAEAPASSAQTDIPEP